MASAAACCLLAARSQANFVDLHVYRMGGAAVLHGGDLYRLRFAWLSFTYPPFAAVVFAALAAVPWSVAAALLTGASAVALPVALYLGLRLPRPRREPAAVAWPLALAAAAGAIWLEPVRTALTYGQVDILVAAAVLYDLTRPDTSRYKGVAIGLAAGLKLTPAIFVAYLLITRRYRAAATAAAAFAGTVAVGFAVLPASSVWYVARNLPGANWLGLSAKVLVHSVAYVLIGLLLLAVAGAYQLRGSPGRPSAPQPGQPAEARHGS